MERSVIMSDGDVLTAADLIFSPIENNVQSAIEKENEALHLGTMEKNTILKVIDKHNGNISKAAKELGLTRTALYRRLNKYEI